MLISGKLYDIIIGFCCVSLAKVTTFAILMVAGPAMKFPEEKTTLDTPTYYLDKTSEDSFPLEVLHVMWDSNMAKKTKLWRQMARSSRSVGECSGQSTTHTPADVFPD